MKECRHPNIMDVNDIIEDENNYYIVSEMIEGGSIFDRLKKKKYFRNLKICQVI